MSIGPVRPTTDENGDEQHPAFGLIGASRVQSGPPGETLFDSDVGHSHYVTVSVRGASRRRDLNRDWIRSRGAEIVEVAMSEAQWASFVSSMNTGNGVPCTIRRRGNEPTPALLRESRLEHSMDEVRDAGTKALARIREKFAAVEEKPTKANIRALKAVIENAPSNMRFAAESLTEHAENVVTKARADIEAMMLLQAEQLGLGSDELQLPELGEGDER